MTAFVADPYPTLTRLRESTPVSVVTSEEGVPIWVVPRYHDARAALADPRLGHDQRRALAIANDRVAGLELGADVVHMLNSDPPDHTRLRRLVRAAFTPGRVAALRPLVERVAGELFAGLAERDTVDLVHDFAFQLPAIVMCELLGLPREDRFAYREWATVVLTHNSAEDSYERAIEDMTAHLSEHVARRRAAPGDDMISDLLRAADDGDLSEHEVVAMAYLLLIAGHETSTNLVSTAMLTLLKHPAEAAWLRADPAATPMAVEELLRYESPLRMAVMRFTTEPVHISGVDIPEDELVLIAIGAANRDPARFPDPDRLVLDRGDTGHLAFGHGMHRCLGALLGKLEAEIALSGLLGRFPDMSLAVEEHELSWRDSIMLRGLNALPVALRG